MKRYMVTFDFGSYICEHTTVIAKDKRELKKILKNHYGDHVFIREIEIERERK